MARHHTTTIMEKSVDGPAIFPSGLPQPSKGVYAYVPGENVKLHDREGHMQVRPLLHDLPLPHFATTTARPEFGLSTSIHLLEDWKVQRYLQRTRSRFGIVPPEDAYGCRANLEEHPPEQFLATSRRVAEDYWNRVFVRPLMDEWQALLAPLWLRFAAWLPLALLRRYTIRQVVAVFALDEVIDTSAYVIARHIVTGLYEIPIPIAIPASAAHVYEIDEDIPILIAIVFPHAHIDRALDQARSAYRDAFVAGQRQTFPSDFAETAWLRFCDRQLKADTDYARAPFQYLSDLSAELTLSPPPAPGSCHFNLPAPTAKSPDTIRHNFAHFDAAKPRLWFYRKANDS